MVGHSLARTGCGPQSVVVGFRSKKNFMYIEAKTRSENEMGIQKWMRR